MLAASENTQNTINIKHSNKKNADAQKNTESLANKDHDEYQYLNLVRNVINHGKRKEDRTGITCGLYQNKTLTSRLT